MNKQNINQDGYSNEHVEKLFGFASSSNKRANYHKSPVPQQSYATSEQLFPYEMNYSAQSYPYATNENKEVSKPLTEKEKYALELQEQIKMKNHFKKSMKDQESNEDRKYLRQSLEKYPFGKHQNILIASCDREGGGAPLLDSRGEIITRRKPIISSISQYNSPNIYNNKNENYEMNQKFDILDELVNYDKRGIISNNISNNNNNNNLLQLYQNTKETQLNPFQYLGKEENNSEKTMKIYKSLDDDAMKNERKKQEYKRVLEEQIEQKKRLKLYEMQKLRDDDLKEEMKWKKTINEENRLVDYKSNQIEAPQLAKDIGNSNQSAKNKHLGSETNNLINEVFSQNKKNIINLGSNSISTEKNFIMDNINQPDSTIMPTIIQKEVQDNQNISEIYRVPYSNIYKENIQTYQAVMLFNQIDNVKTEILESHKLFFNELQNLKREAAKGLTENLTAKKNFNQLNQMKNDYDYDILDEYSKKIDLINEKTLGNPKYLGGYGGLQSIGKNPKIKIYDKNNLTEESNDETQIHIQPLQGQSRYIAMNKLHELSGNAVINQNNRPILENDNERLDNDMNKKQIDFHNYQMINNNNNQEEQKSLSEISFMQSKKNFNIDNNQYKSPKNDPYYNNIQDHQNYSSLDNQKLIQPELMYKSALVSNINQDINPSLNKYGQHDPDPASTLGLEALSAEIEINIQRERFSGYKSSPKLKKEKVNGYNAQLREKDMISPGEASNLNISDTKYADNNKQKNQTIDEQNKTTLNKSQNNSKEVLNKGDSIERLDALIGLYFPGKVQTV